MHILGKRTILRAIEKEDLATLHKWFSDPEVASQLGDVRFPSSRDGQDQWFQRIQNDEHTIRLGVQQLDGPLIGYAGFWNVHWRDRRAEIAYLIGDAAFRGQGYGREAIATLARYAFAEMDLFRLDATALETNRRSVDALTACGFQIEGVLRSHALRGGQRTGRVLLGLLATEYFEWTRQTDYWK